VKLSKKVDEGKSQEFSLNDGVLWFRDSLCVHNIPEMKKELLKEPHDSSLVTHPRSTKMYQDLKRHYWWIGTKRDIAEYVARCLTYQRFKAEHQKPGGLLQPLPICEEMGAHHHGLHYWIATNKQAP